MDNKQQKVNELLASIEMCNKKIAEINRKTAVEIGRKKEITENLEKMLKQYKEKYGVELSLDNKEKIEEEYNKVIEERAAQAEKMEKVLSYIEQGKYTEVNLMLGVSTTDKKEELKNTILEQSKSAITQTTRIDFEEEEENNKKSGIKEIKIDIDEDTQSIDDNEKVQESNSDTEDDRQGKFSFDGLFSTSSSKAHENTEADEDGSFFTLPSSKDNVFGNFGSLVEGTRFQPK